MDNVVRCYRGIDPVDGCESLFAIKNGLVAPLIYTGEQDLWLTSDGFGNFDEWCSNPEGNDEAILAALDTFELLWEKQE